MRISGTAAACRSVGAALRNQKRKRQRAAELRPLDDGALEVWDQTFANESCQESLELECHRRADALAGVLLKLACARSGKAAGLRQGSSPGGDLGIWCR